MTRWCTASARCYRRCPATPGSSGPICVCSTALCTGIQARSCSLCGPNSVSGGLGSPGPTRLGPARRSGPPRHFPVVARSQPALLRKSGAAHTWTKLTCACSEWLSRELPKRVHEGQISTCTGRFLLAPLLGLEASSCHAQLVRYPPFGPCPAVGRRSFAGQFVLSAMAMLLLPPCRARSIEDSPARPKPPGSVQGSRPLAGAPALSGRAISPERHAVGITVDVTTD